MIIVPEDAILLIGDADTSISLPLIGILESGLVWRCAAMVARQELDKLDFANTCELNAYSVERFGDRFTLHGYRKDAP